MSVDGIEIARAYENGELCGWAEHHNPGLARSEFRLLSKGGLFLPFRITRTTRQRYTATGKKVMLYLLARKLLGQDITFYPQEIGDCVSFGAKNAAELLQVVQKLIKGDAIKWRPVFPPYYYGTGRVYVGRGRLGNQDGSLGSWMAQAVMRYGTLFADEPNVPKYSGRVAKAYGDPDPRNDLDLWLPTAKNYLIQGAALIKTWPDLVEAIANGYPVTCASNVGFEMEPRRDGFHYVGRRPWPHQMAFIGVDDNERNPYAVVQNQWGHVHGDLKDFADGHNLPKGCLRIRRDAAELILRANESFAYSHMRGFPDQSAEIEKAMFDLIGN